MMKGAAHETKRFGWLMGVLFAVCFWDVLIGTRSFYFRDFSLFGYPIAAHLRRSFWAGELPLWNPYNNCGLPFLAQWNTMALYPGCWLIELLPLPWSVNVFCLAHLVLGGFGMRHLLWRWSKNRLATDVAGLLFAFNGLALNCLMWPNNSAAWGWMPLVVGMLAGQTSLSGRSRREEALISEDLEPPIDVGFKQSFLTSAPTRKVALAAGVAAMQILTGAPEVILFTWLLGIVLALTIGGWRQILFVAAAGAIAAALTAPQLWPFLELYFESHRTGKDFATGEWAMAPTGLLHFLVPLFSGAPTEQGVYLQEAQKWTSSYYVGAFAIVLAVVGAIRTRITRALAAIAAAFIFFAHRKNTIGVFP
jgi:hypothetical protein